MNKDSSNSGAGFMVWWARQMMRLRMFKFVFFMAVMGSIGMLIFASMMLYNDGDKEAVKCLIVAFLPFTHTVNYVDPGSGQTFIFDAMGFWPHILPWVKFRIIIASFIAPALAFFGIMAAGESHFRKKDEKMNEPRYVEGSRLVTPEEIIKQMRKNKIIAEIPLGEVKMAVDTEQYHVFCCGRAGMGKTQTFSKALVTVRRRPGTKGLVYGFKADDYFRKHYDPARGDILFSPIDIRSQAWNLFDEVKPDTAVFDLSAIAGSLIPTPAGAGQNAWVYDDARTVFESLLIYLYTSSQRDMATLWNALKLDKEGMAKAFEGVEGCEAGFKLVSNVKGQASDTIISAMTQACRFFRFMVEPSDGWNITKWLNSNDSSFIFLQNSPEAEDMMRPILTLFIDMVTRRILALPDSKTRRIFYMVDEIGTLEKLSSLHRLITLGRSKGVSFWLGTQDIGQLLEKYGKNLTESLLNSCGTSVIMGSKDSTSAEYMSKLIGKQKFIRTNNSTTGGVSDMFGDRTSKGEQSAIEDLVMPSVIQNLPPLRAYIKLQDYDWSLNKIEPVSYPNETEGLIPSPIIKI